MNKSDYLAEVDALRAGPALRSRIAAPPRRRAPRSARLGRWLSLAACLLLVAGVAAALPGLLRSLNPGGDINIPPIVTDPVSLPAATVGGIPLTVYAGSDAPPGVIPELVEAPVGALLEVTGLNDGAVSETETRRFLDTGEETLMGGGTGASGTFSQRLDERDLGPTRWVLSYTYEDGTVKDYCFFYRCVPAPLPTVEAPGAGFENYAAPLLPLMAHDYGQGGPTGLTVDRTVTIDLSDDLQLLDGGDFPGRAPYPRVTDRYVVHNDTGADWGGPLFFPWTGSLTVEDERCVPTVTVDDVPLGLADDGHAPRPIPGATLEGDAPLGSWEDYTALFSGYSSIWPTPSPCSSTAWGTSRSPSTTWRTSGATRTTWTSWTPGAPAWRWSSPSPTLSTPRSSPTASMATTPWTRRGIGCGTAFS